MADFLHLNKDAMNGINLMKIFQRAAGWCEAVYGVKCLTREQKTLSGYVIFRAKCTLSGPHSRTAYFLETAKPKQHTNKSGTAEAYAFVS